MFLFILSICAFLMALIGSCTEKNWLTWIGVVLAIIVIFLNIALR